jgi:DNA-binding transcriptional LysR family regulator
MVGMGISVLPTVAVAAELARGDLVALPWRGPDLELQTQMIRHRQKWMSAAVRAFWDLSRTILSDPAREAGESRADVAA